MIRPDRLDEGTSRCLRRALADHDVGAGVDGVVREGKYVASVFAVEKAWPGATCSKSSPSAPP
jgi:hypothetical protein